MEVNDNDTCLSSLCGVIKKDYSRWYLLTIGKCQKKDIVKTQSLLNTLELLKLKLGDDIHVYEYVEEFGTMYHQRHLHCVVGAKRNQNYFYRYTKLNGFRLHWKSVPYNALSDVRKYLRKDIDPPILPEKILSLDEGTESCEVYRSSTVEGENILLDLIYEEYMGDLLASGYFMS